MEITSILNFRNFYLIQIFIAILLCPVSESQNLLRDTGSSGCTSKFEDEIFSVVRRLLVSRFSVFEQEMKNQLQGVKQEIVQNKLENEAAVMKLSQSVQDLSLTVSQIVTERNSNREHINSSLNQYHNITITIKNEMSVLRHDVTATNRKMLDKIVNMQMHMGELAENVTINRNKIGKTSAENRKLHVMIKETDSELLNTEAKTANKFQDQQLNASIQLNAIRSDVSVLRNSTNRSEKAVLKNLEKLATSLNELVKNFSTPNKFENDVCALQSEVEGLNRRMSNKIADMQVHIDEIIENVTVNRNETHRLSLENSELHDKIQKTDLKLLKTMTEIENKSQDHQYNASLQLNAIPSDLSVLRNSTKRSEKAMLEKIDKLAISLNELTQNFSSTVTIEKDLSVLQNEVKALNRKMSDKIANMQMNMGEIVENVTMNRNETDQLSAENSKLHIKIRETDSKLLNIETEIKNKFQDQELNVSLYLNAIQSDLYALRRATNYNEKVILRDLDNLTANLHELIQNFSLTNANVELLLEFQIQQDRKINNITKQQVVFETEIQRLNNESSYFSGIVFDLSTIHKKIFASKNRTFLSNTNFKDAIAGPGIRALTQFYGSQINRYVTAADDLSFDVTLKYEIIKDPSRYMLFGIALCTRGDMDKKHYGSNTCWLLQIADKDDNIRAEFYHNSKIWKTVVVSSAALGTKATLRYTMSVSGPKKTISYKDRDTGITLYTFSGVDFSEPLFPLFGVYSKTHFTSSLSLA